MRYARGFSPLVTVIVVLVLIAGVAAVWYFSPHAAAPLSENSGQAPSTVSTDSPQASSGQALVAGGDRDSHGCIGSAGYEWCEAKQKCLRQWEEQCGPAALDPAFNALVAIRAADSGIFGYATSTAFEWRLAGNATTTIGGFAITATGAHASDQDAARKYFTDSGFTQSIPNEAGGPTGGLEGYEKGALACALEFAFTDVTTYPDRPIRVNSDAQDITVSCGISNL